VLDRLQPIRRLDDPIARIMQQVGKHVSNEPVVFDDQHLPSRQHRETGLPAASTMRATIARRMNRPKWAALVALIAGVVAVAIVITAMRVPTADATLSVDPSQRYQRIDGFGVNANPKNWRSTDLAPAIDRLVDDLHATLWRVDVA